jgi:hypothetical protein
MKRGLSLIVALLAVGISPGANAKQAKPLFASDDVLQISLRGPMGKLAFNRPDREEALPGTVLEGGRSLPVMLSARGITRRDKAVCKFPPIRVEFQKPPPESVFAKQKGLKLVTYCDPAESFQRFVLLEYAAYRMYQLLTDRSLRVRLARVDYAEADGGHAISRLGFFIEDVDDTAKRNDLVEATTGDHIVMSALDAAASGRQAMFEYMIGNLDWSMYNGPTGSKCCHNTKLIGPPDAVAGFTPIPYDFDFSGLVDAPYAQPPDGINIVTVRTRVYRGYCRFNTDAAAAAADIRGHKQALLAVLDQVPELDDASRRKAKAFLGQFFDQIGDDAQVQTILRNCIR